MKYLRWLLWYIWTAYNDWGTIYVIEQKNHAKYGQFAERPLMESSGHFFLSCAKCDTRQRCCVLLWRHTANVPAFAGKQGRLCCVPLCQGTRQGVVPVNPLFALLLFFVVGQLSTHKTFVMYPEKDTRQRWLCRLLIAVCFLPCVTHDKSFTKCKSGFTVCPWHTVKKLYPAVRVA